MTATIKNRFTYIEGLYLFLALVILPGFFLQQGFTYFEQQRHSQIIAEASTELLKPLQELKKYPDNEAFWCMVLTDAYRKSQTPKDFVMAVKKLEKITGESLRYVVWKSDKKIEESNFLDIEKRQEWHSLIKNAHTARFATSASKRIMAEDKLRQYLGAHYLGENLQNPYLSQNPTLIRADSAGKKPLIWLNYGSRISAMVFFSPDVLKKDQRKKLILKRWQNENLQITGISSQNFADRHRKYSKELQQARLLHLKTGNEIFRFNSLLVSIGATSTSQYLACFRQIPELAQNAGKQALLISLTALFLAIILIRSGYLSIQPGNIAITCQLALLLFISAGIPLMSLGLVAIDYLQRKQEHLVKMAYQKCIEYSQDIDRRSQTETSQALIRSQKGIKEFIDGMNRKEPVAKSFTAAFEFMHPAKSDFRIVASSGQFITSQNGYYKDGIYHRFDQANATDKPGKPGHFSQEMKVLNDLGSYYLTFTNKAHIDPKRFTEIELITEMFYQKSLTEIIHDLVMENSSITRLGWGSDSFPVFTSTASLHRASGLNDYFAVIPHSPQRLSQEYFRRQADNLARNQLGLKIFLTDGAFIFPGELHIYKIPELAAMFSRLGANPANEVQTGEYAGERYIFAGFQGQLLSHFKILALSPMRTIEEKISKERYFIVYSGLAALIILISVTLLFGHSFIFPLRQLQIAAEAVEQRKFGFKLPNLSTDEFGEMGKIFNQSISELEELAIASIVQSKLMPAHDIDAGKFDIFGKSSPMADLGGDYFDYFITDNDHFATLLGDVAGHGVGASLIMAMAKAGIICSQPFLAEPARVISQLHKMICATRSKTQRKIMTFQYLHLNRHTGKGKYANAGGCSPLLVNRRTGLATEISQPAPVLGGFKNAKFTETELVIDADEALVFYTDGIIEVQNSAGEELGYERFQKILVQNYCSNARKYYDAVFANYLEWLGNGPPQDDLTLIIVVNKNNESAGNLN